MIIIVDIGHSHYAFREDALEYLEDAIKVEKTGDSWKATEVKAVDHFELIRDFLSKVEEDKEEEKQSNQYCSWWLDERTKTAVLEKEIEKLKNKEEEVKDDVQEE